MKPLKSEELYMVKEDINFYFKLNSIKSLFNPFADLSQIYLIVKGLNILVTCYLYLNTV